VRVSRRTGFTVLVLVMACGMAPPGAGAQRPPTPEPNFATTILPRPCAYEGNDRYEREFYEREGWPGPDYERYPGACQRLRFSYGPIVVKPGQNDVLIGPVTIEKPVQNGYITRFAPNLVRADGTVPPTEQVHLHHGTWLSSPDYGSGPFFAAGEEKTIAPFPKGYGMPVKATDQWLLLYMVHSAVQQPMEMFITYDVDFVPQAKADPLGIKPAYPVWLDVRPSAYPVFNTQRDYGGEDGTCTWPKEECASFDPWGNKFTGQGQPGNGVGTDLRLPARGQPLGRIESFQGGTLIGIGGHVHPGGLQNEIDLVRGDRSERIYTGKPVYWDRNDTSQPGGPPNTWDFSMRVTGLPNWGVKVEPGDRLRSNATYDTTQQSTYENMGIAVTLLAPDKPDGTPTAPGLDPFAAPKDTSEDCSSGGLSAGTLCDKGVVTHGHLPENDNYGGPDGTWNAQRGSATNNVAIANFLYLPGDLTTLSMTGVPTVRLGSTLRFTNAEGGLIYHTATSCAFPCKGETGTSFPLADGETSTGRQLDFDSSEMGFGAPAIGPAKQSLNYELPVTREEGYQPGEIVTYYCRIHPSMRGAFEVVE
jgi:plastocyanin